MKNTKNGLQRTFLNVFCEILSFVVTNKRKYGIIKGDGHKAPFLAALFFKFNDFICQSWRKNKK